MIAVAALSLVLALQSPPAAPSAPPETVDLRVDDQPLLVLLERIARQCDRGLVVDADLVETLGRKVTIDARGVAWSEAVDLFRREYRLTIQVTERRIEVVDSDESFRRQLVRRAYPVAQLTEPLRNYEAPHLGSGHRSDAAGAGLLSLGEGDVVLIDELLEWIKAAIRSETWDQDAVEIFVDESDNWLRVRQLPALHEALSAFLHELERNVARQLVCRLIRLPDGEYADVLTAEELGPLIAGHVPLAAFVLADGQRNHHFQGITQRFTADVETVHEAIDPVVADLRTGWVLDVEPHITRDGILCNLFIGRAANPEFATRELRSDADTVLAEFALPSIDVEGCADTRLIPRDGAAVHRLEGVPYAVQFVVAGE